MKLALDKYAHLNSPIHRWQQNYKLVGLLSFIFAFAFIQNIWLLPIISGITVVIFLLSKLPFRFLLSRLRYPGWFIVAVVIFLPFFAGDTTILDWGYITIKAEGSRDALLISVRFFCILTISLVLFGTASFLSSVRAMRKLGVPSAIVDMTLLSYRYLEELGEMLTTMQRAMRLRGFQAKGLSHRKLEIFAQLTGSILVRSYERSLLVYQAMILRGYGNKVEDSNNNKHIQKPGDRYSLLATVISISMAIFLILIETLLEFQN